MNFMMKYNEIASGGVCSTINEEMVKFAANT